MDLLAWVVRLGSLLSVLAAVAALALLVVAGPGGGVVPTAGLYATLALVAVAVVAAAAWGRRTAPRERETPYWLSDEPSGDDRD